LCSECSTTSSNCDTYSAGGIILIVGVSLSTIIISAIIIKCLRKRSKSCNVKLQLNESIEEMEENEYKAVN